MSQIARIFIAIAVLLSGTALVPLVELPQETFRWQRYASVYEDPFLDLNHTSGQPGSFFTFTGSNFPMNTAGTVSVNGVQLGLITTDAAGGFIFLIDSTSADEGNYQLTVVVDAVSQTASFTLDAGAPLQPQDGSGPIFLLPSGIALHTVFLPVIRQ